MRLSIQQIFQRIASTVLQDPTMPSAGGSEYNLWLSFLNTSIQEWANAHDWEDLRLEFRPSFAGATTATIPLPQDFVKLAASPVNYGTGIAGGEEWTEIVPEQEHLYSSLAKWVQVRGDINNGYNMIWSPGTLASGTTVVIQYFSIPTSLASPAQIPPVPDSGFLIDRVTAFILEARSDPRFQSSEVKAREKLLNMVQNADAKKWNSYGGNTPIISTLRRINFRVGRDG